MSIPKKMTTVSLSFGALAFFVPFFISPTHLKWRIITGLCLPILWGGTLASCVVRFEKAGLWFLVGGPLVAFWPLLLCMALYWPFLLFFING